jgi:hypothetical protein
MFRIGIFAVFLLMGIATSALPQQALPVSRETGEARKEAREEADLVAQQEMARWAFPTLAATCASAAVSIAALVGLFASLQQTRKAIRDNRELGEAGIRAYVEAESVAFASDGDALTVHFANMGQTPVTSFKTTVELLRVQANEISKSIRLPTNAEMKAFDGIGCGGHGKRTVRVPPSSGSDIIRLFTSNSTPEGEVCLLLGRIDYVDIFGFEWTTGFSFFTKGDSFLEPFHTLPTYKKTTSLDVK